MSERSLGRQFPFATVTNEYAQAMITPSGYIYNLATDDEHQHEGHATRLVQEMVDKADQEGRRLLLSARPELRSFYARFGFVYNPAIPGVRGLPVMEREPRPTV